MFFWIIYSDSSDSRDTMNIPVRTFQKLAQESVELCKTKETVEKLKNVIGIKITENKASIKQMNLLQKEISRQSQITNV